MNRKYEYLHGNMNSWLPWTNFKEQLNHSSTNNYKTTFPRNMARSLRKKNTPKTQNSRVCTKGTKVTNAQLGPWPGPWPAGRPPGRLTGRPDFFNFFVFFFHPKLRGMGPRGPGGPWGVFSAYFWPIFGPLGAPWGGPWGGPWGPPIAAYFP